MGAANRGRRKRYTRWLIRDADVVLCTLLSAHKDGLLKCLHDDHFGLTVIDECSQGTESSCYPAMLRSTKLLLAGDHKQLPPTVISMDAPDLLVSLMERLVGMYGERVVRRLSVQYRMHEDIMRWPSVMMYEESLVAHTSVKQQLLCHLPGVRKTEDTDGPLLLIDTNQCPGFEEKENRMVKSSGRWNDGEAALVVGQIRKLLAAGLKEEQLGIITPYTKQVKLLQCLLRTEFPSVEVQTVDGFQGRENEVIILSMVRSNHKGEIGFLSEKRRLNVAVTRARRNLTVICNTSTIKQNSFLNSFVTYMTENGRVVSASDLEEGFSWSLSHEALNCIEAKTRRKTVPWTEFYIHLKREFDATSPTECEKLMASFGDKIRQYQMLFLYAMNPDAYSHKKSYLINRNWNFSDLPDVEVITKSLLNHYNQTKKQSSDRTTEKIKTLMVEILLEHQKKIITEDLTCDSEECENELEYQSSDAEDLSKTNNDNRSVTEYIRRDSKTSNTVKNYLTYSVNMGRIHTRSSSCRNMRNSKTNSRRYRPYERIDYKKCFRRLDYYKETRRHLIRQN